MTLDEKLIAALRDDYVNAPLSEQDRVMLDYVIQLTKDATRLTPDDHRKLQAVGFDEQGVLQITLIASWFNYINRVADALGVGRGKKEDWNS
jgi:alkylhydroperoxidase family enzyme